MTAPNAEVFVRDARFSDIPALVGLLALLFSIEEGFAFDEAKQRRGLEMMLQDTSARQVFVAEADGGVVGMCSVQTLISTAEGAAAATVEDVVVQPAFQGQGVGRRLLDALEGWCRGRGITRLHIMADRNNPPALDFYRRLEWQPTQLICLRKNIA